MRWKPTGALLTASSLAVVVAACGGGAAPASPTTAPTSAPAAAATTAPAAQPTMPPAATNTQPPAPTTAPATPAAATKETPPLDAVTRSFNKMVDVKSFRFRGQGTTDGQPEEITGEFVLPDSFHLTTKDGEIIFVPGALYAKDPSTGKWTGLKISDEEAAKQTPLFNPADEVKKLSSAQNFTLVGADIVDGTPTTVYSYNETQSGKTTTTKIWIAVTDGLPRKMEQTIDGKVDGTFFFSDYGNVPPITAPAGAEVIDLSQLGKDLQTLPVPSPNANY